MDLFRLETLPKTFPSYSIRVPHYFGYSQENVGITAVYNDEYTFTQWIFNIFDDFSLFYKRNESLQQLEFVNIYRGRKNKDDSIWKREDIWSFQF